MPQAGIGRAITARLEREGMRVLAVNLRPDDDGPGEPFVADLTTRDGNQTGIEAAVERFGRLDAVIPNAGFQHVSPVGEFAEDSWDALVSLILTSPFLLANYGWSALEASGSGRFVAITSDHRNNYAARTRRDGGQRIAEDIAQRLRFPIEPEPYVAQLAALGHDACERLGAVSHPTLVVHGAEDRMVHPDDARLLAERIPAAELQLWEQTGHLFFTDEAGVDPAVSEFSARDLEICKRRGG